MLSASRVWFYIVLTGVAHSAVNPEGVVYVYTSTTTGVCMYHTHQHLQLTLQPGHFFCLSTSCRSLLHTPHLTPCLIRSTVMPSQGGVCGQMDERERGQRSDRLCCSTSSVAHQDSCVWKPDGMHCQLIDQYIQWFVSMTSIRSDRWANTVPIIQWSHYDQSKRMWRCCRETNSEHRFWKWTFLTVNPNSHDALPESCSCLT